MAEGSIPVDLRSPGQVLGAIGFAEAATVLVGDAEGAFDWSSPTETRFLLRVPGGADPFLEVLSFLSRAEAVAEAPHRSRSLNRWIGSWGPRPHELAMGAPYPFRDPKSPATLQAVLVADGRRVPLVYWGDGREQTGRDNFKLWAGAGGYPGVALANDALRLVRGALATCRSDPFSVSVSQTSSFRLDWRGDYVPIDAGFSLNKHPRFESAGFPVVELMAAIGLTHARPDRPGRSKLEYRYGVVGRASPADGGAWFPLSFLRAALGGGALPWPRRTFRIALGWPGKEGQARSIQSVQEEADR